MLEQLEGDYDHIAAGDKSLVSFLASRIGADLGDMCENLNDLVTEGSEEPMFKDDIAFFVLERE